MNRHLFAVAASAVIVLVILLCFSMIVLAPIQRDLANIKTMLAVSVDPPQQFTKELEQFEERLSDEPNWPSTSKAASSLRDDYQQFTERAPMITTVDWRRRLLAIRWGIESLSYAIELHNFTSVEQFDAIQGDCQLLLDEAPQAALPFQDPIRRHLERVLSSATERNRQQLHQQAEASAKLALEGGGNLEAAWSSLEPFQDEGSKELRSKLQLQLIENRVEENLKQFRKQLEIAGQSGNSSLQQAGMAHVLQAAIELYYSLAEQQPPPGILLGWSME